MTSSGPSLPPQLGVIASQPRSSTYLPVIWRAASALASRRARWARAQVGGGMASSMETRVSAWTGHGETRQKRIASRRIRKPPLRSNPVGVSMRRCGHSPTKPALCCPPCGDWWPPPACLSWDQSSPPSCCLHSRDCHLDLVTPLASTCLAPNPCPCPRPFPQTCLCLCLCLLLSPHASLVHYQHTPMGRSLYKGRE